MKKFTLFAAFAALAMSASAQDFVAASPYAEASVTPGKPAIFDVIVATEDVTEALKAAGQTVNVYAINEETINLYIWESGETFNGGSSAYPGAGYDNLGAADSYISLDIANAGWSGAGINIAEGAGMNTTHWSDETRFHVALRSGTAPNVPNAIGIQVADYSGGKGAYVTVGAEPFEPAYPVIAPKITSDWTAVDISFADLKKFSPQFNYGQVEAWSGNILGFLAGGVEGQNLCIDLLYFYTPSGEEGAVGTVADDAQFVVTSNTVNVANGNGIELYDLSGRLVKTTSSNVLGISELRGAYIVKSGNSVKKIMK